MLGKIAGVETHQSKSKKGAQNAPLALWGKRGYNEGSENPRENQRPRGLLRENAEKREVDTYAEKAEDPCGGQFHDGSHHICPPRPQYG